MSAVLTEPLLILRFTKRSNDRHQLSFTRADGSGETLDLETRSFLMHDFLHIAVESEAKLQRGVFGTLAAGKCYAAMAANDMTAAAADDTHELYTIEKVVGPLTSVVQGRTNAAQFLSDMRAQFALSGETFPEWLTDATVAGIQDRYRQLIGAWKATPFGATMEVRFSL